ncbi:Hypothetical predicted protein [Cloeon dipterum]|uniref:Uncharacterized protein n=1 Tax=Cloeon dipterum TaxID=197152 RepID=A0A8S1C1P3_9INSE|nr:Hypothetical predicted protein [Cloeon dipterum]
MQYCGPDSQPDSRRRRRTVGCSLKKAPRRASESKRVSERVSGRAGGPARRIYQAAALLRQSRECSRTKRIHHRTSDQLSDIPLTTRNAD